MAEVLGAYERHLVSERDLTPHTVRAYLGDLRSMLDQAARLGHADDGSPVGTRDVAILELLYATGIRVGELCGLDVDDVDHERRVVRVFGKGRKERTVPFGLPAERALGTWLRTGRPALMAPGAGRW